MRLRLCWLLVTCKYYLIFSVYSTKLQSPSSAKEPALSISCPHEGGMEDGFSVIDNSAMKKCYVYARAEQTRFQATTIPEADQKCMQAFKQGHLSIIYRGHLPAPSSWNVETMYWILNSYEVLRVWQDARHRVVATHKVGERRRLQKRPPPEMKLQRFHVRFRPSGALRNSQTDFTAVVNTDFEITVDDKADLDYNAVGVILTKAIDNPWCSYFRKNNQLVPRYEGPRLFACMRKTFKWNVYVCECEPYFDCYLQPDPNPMCVYVQSKNECFTYYKHRLKYPPEAPYGRCNFSNGLDYSKPCSCDKKDGCSTTYWSQWSLPQSPCGKGFVFRYRPPVEAPDQVCGLNDTFCCSEKAPVSLPSCACKAASIECYNGGTCVDEGADNWFCLCAEGYIGKRCETDPTRALILVTYTVFPTLMFIFGALSFLVAVLLRRRRIWREIQRQTQPYEHEHTWPGQGPWLEFAKSPMRPVHAKFWH